jgi:hypothetical protein
VVDKQPTLLSDDGWRGGERAGHLLDIAGLPGIVDCCFGWAVEPQDRKVALAGHGREPIALLAVRRFGPRHKSVVPSAFCAGLSREPSHGNGVPALSPGPVPVATEVATLINSAR